MRYVHQQQNNLTYVFEEISSLVVVNETFFNIKFLRVYCENFLDHKMNFIIMKSISFEIKFFFWPENYARPYANNVKVCINVVISGIFNIFFYQNFCNKSFIMHKYEAFINVWLSEMRTLSAIRNHLSIIW